MGPLFVFLWAKMAVFVGCFFQVGFDNGFHSRWPLIPNDRRLDCPVSKGKKQR